MIEIHSLLKLHALIAIANGPIHGYELLQQLAMRTGRTVSPSQVYPFLSELRKGGFVAVQDTGTRERKRYALTVEGKTLLEPLLNRCNDLVDLAIREKITPCHHCGAEIYSGKFKRKVDGVSRLFCCPHCAAAFDKERHSH